MGILNKLIRIVLVVSALFFMVSCYYDKKDQVYPQVVATACDTTTVTYATTIAPILTTNCNVCHSTAAAASSGGGIALDNYTNVKTYATNGRLYASMSQNGMASPMPKNGAKLDNCTLNKIAVWINRGALNN